MLSAPTMINDEDTYYEAGVRCGEARSKGDASRAQRHQDWFSRAMSLEKPENAAKAKAAFDRGYRDGGPQRTPEYFKEEELQIGESETDSKYIDSNLGPLLDDETQYGYSLKIQSPNVKTKWMTINKDQLVRIIAAMKLKTFGMNENDGEKGVPPVKGGDKLMRWANDEVASINDRLESGFAVAKLTTIENAVRYNRIKWNKLDWNGQKKYADQMNRKVQKYNIMFKDETFIAVPKSMYDQVQLPELPPKDYSQQYSA